MAQSIWLTALASVASLAFSLPALAEGELPLRHVRLYETGVAYFERSGPVRPKQVVTLPIAAGHLDDALKTLVVLDGSGQVRVSGVEFGSGVSRTLGRALAGLPADGDSALDLTALLSSLEGAAVELRVGSETIAGRLIDVLDTATSGVVRCLPAATPSAPCTPQPEGALVFLTERGEIRRFALSDVTSARPLDPARQTRLRTALDAISRGGERSRALSVEVSGGTHVSLAYLGEAPVWRASYRLVLADGTQAALQGWALVHNDTDEDWRQIGLDLVNGRPDSFLFPLAAPRYARRELVTPEQELSTVPQLLDRTVDDMWELEGGTGLGLSGTGAGGGGRGEGIGLGMIGTYGAGAGAADGSSSVVSVGSLAALAPTLGVESQALFQYSLARPLDLRAHGSALVPFAAERIGAQRIALFEPEAVHARSGIHLTNDTQQTLPPGTIAIFAEGGFAGESALARTKPGEERFLTFGLDLDVELDIELRSTADEPRLLRLERGELVEHFVRKYEVDYRLTNRSRAARSVHITLGYLDNAKVSGADRLAYDVERSRALAVFDVKGQTERATRIRVDEGRAQRTALDGLRAAYLERLARVTTLPAAQRVVLERARVLAEQRDASLAQGEALTDVLERELTDLKRIRATVAALPGSKTRASRRLLARLVAAEERVTELRVQLVRRDAAVANLQKQISAELGRLNAVRG